MCKFISFYALSQEAQAAWAQAVLSALAILAAAYFPVAQRRRQQRLEINTYVELISRAEIEAESAVTFLRLAVGRQILTNEPQEWMRLAAAFNAIPLHALPDFRLLSILQDAARSVEKIQELYRGALSSRSGITPVLPELIDTERQALAQCYEDAAQVSNSLASRFTRWNARRKVKRRRRKLATTNPKVD